MGWLEGALWGAFGGFAMEALDYIIAVRRWRKLPWDVGASSLGNNHEPSGPASDHSAGELPEPGFLAYAIAGILRVAVGCGAAAAITSTSPAEMTAWLVVLAGATAPIVLEKITMFVPLVVQVGKGGIIAAIQQAQAPLPPGSPVAGSPSPPGGNVPAQQDGTGSTSGQAGV